MVFKSSSLTPVERAIIQNKGTERPYSGKYEHVVGSGTYLCRQCGLALFRAKAQFNSGCGWPSFDKDIPGNVRRSLDRDGHRTEILCNRCTAHLGHVFEGERHTPSNTRHCVNALSLDWVNDTDVKDTEEAIYAAGCFWGVEYYLKRLPGVLKTEVGYTGGSLNEPSYEDICHGNTGHYEAIRVVYDPTKCDYKTLTQFFFEIHDPTQKNGQGPDHGQQYLSAIFYYDDAQKKIAKNLIALLKEKGYDIATQLLPVQFFWPAEDYHQDYYEKTHKQPYCHRYTKKF